MQLRAKESISSKDIIPNLGCVISLYFSAVGALRLIETVSIYQENTCTLNIKTYFNNNILTNELHDVSLNDNGSFNHFLEGISFKCEVNKIEISLIFYRGTKVRLRAFKLIEADYGKTYEYDSNFLPSRIFDNNDMLPPNPQDVPISEGRFNHFGQGHWYLGDSIDLCGAECSHKKNCVLWFQKVEIEQATDILDLAKDYIYNYFNPDNTDGYSLPIAVAALLWSGILTKEQQIKGFWKPEYFITRYIADICKEKGINGIIYPSSLYSSGRNVKGINPT